MGFFEQTRLAGTRKTEILMAGLSLAPAWCYAVGEWSARELEPIKLKPHGRKERSLFGRGLDELMSLFNGRRHMLRSLSQVAFGFIRRVAIEFVMKIIVYSDPLSWSTVHDIFG